MAMTNKDLQNLIKKLIKDDFNPVTKHNHKFTATAKFAKLPSVVGGSTDCKTGDITLDPSSYTKFNKVVFIKLVKHEICHYILGAKAGHGKKFLSLLHKVGGMRYAPLITRPIACYECPKCHRVYNYKFLLNSKNDKCKYCNKKLHMIYHNKLIIKAHKKHEAIEAKISKLPKKQQAFIKAFVKIPY